MTFGIENKELDMSIKISHLPNKKKMCLFIREGNVETKYASFSSNEAAEIFMNKLCKFMNINPEGSNYDI